ncbi:MAG: serine--tRNA ligase [Phycisphaeraceae bacterium]|nr:serine--tRNA ligase [Phycisphaeraceae bacterium]MCB9847484.1 serine--tRNA ligase [Phycisphaeraceae bacterium]
MIDLKHLREDPEHYRKGARLKNVDIDIDRVLGLDERRRAIVHQQEQLRAEQKQLEKQSGQQIGQLMGRMKAASGDERSALERELASLRAAPAALKEKIQGLDVDLTEIEPELSALLLEIPQPPDADVPEGAGSDDNVEIRRWSPPGYDLGRSFEQNRGFPPRTHLELLEMHGLVDFERGVKMAGSRSYVLTGDGMRLHQAALRYAFDFMTSENGFTPMSVPVIVREECMVGTGFFPSGRDQAYLVDEQSRGGSNDLFLTGTGEVGLMGLHQNEILDESALPLTYTTVSTCFRREAGAAGKDTAGLYRIHQFDKVEQVVICRADEQESRAWHQKMLGFVETLLQRLGLPYRLLQCCTGDLGMKNADMIDVECWMPGRGEEDANGRPLGAFGETHSASRLYGYQCRRLNMRYRGDSTDGKPAVCHSLNNTVLASPRILIPILEMHQNKDGSITIPEALRPHLGGAERIG